jgi:hypothetical protein
MQQIENAPGYTVQPRRPRLNSILENRICIADIAAETDMCERTARNEMDRLNVPYVKFGNVRWYDRDEVRVALLASAVRKTPRGRGRPRKTA